MTGQQAYAILKSYIQETLSGAGALKGEDGKSAYQLAVEEGYKGTLNEWLVHLVGADGKSAYELAVDLGFEGTEEEWIASLKGKDGVGAVYDFIQSTPSDTWTITHSLGYRYPNVVCADTEGNGLLGSIKYVSDSVTVIHFDSPVSGTAHLSYGSGGGGDLPGGSYLKVEVLDRGEYEALAEKDPNTLYMLRG